MTLREAIENGTLREHVLAHVAAIQKDGVFGARFPVSEMIEEADSAVREGELAWRDDVPFPGRFLTAKGRERLDAFEALASGPTP